jgi:hypothetical protein
VVHSCIGELETGHPCGGRGYICWELGRAGREEGFVVLTEQGEVGF